MKISKNIKYLLIILFVIFIIYAYRQYTNIKEGSGGVRAGVGLIDDLGRLWGTAGRNAAALVDDAAKAAATARTASLGGNVVRAAGVSDDVLRSTGDDVFKAAADSWQYNEDAVRLAVKEMDELRATGNVVRNIDDATTLTDDVIKQTVDDIAKKTGESTEEVLKRLVDSGADNMDDALRRVGGDVAMDAYKANMQTLGAGFADDAAASFDDLLNVGDELENLKKLGYIDEGYKNTAASAMADKVNNITKNYAQNGIDAVDAANRGQSAVHTKQLQQILAKNLDDVTETKQLQQLAKNAHKQIDVNLKEAAIKAGGVGADLAAETATKMDDAMKLAVGKANAAGHAKGTVQWQREFTKSMVESSAGTSQKLVAEVTGSTKLWEIMGASKATLLDPFKLGTITSQIGAKFSAALKLSVATPLQALVCTQQALMGGGRMLILIEVGGLFSMVYFMLPQDEEAFPTAEEDFFAQVFEHGEYYDAPPPDGKLTTNQTLDKYYDKDGNEIKLPVYDPYGFAPLEDTTNFTGDGYSQMAGSVPPPPGAAYIPAPGAPPPIGIRAQLASATPPPPGQNENPIKLTPNDYVALIEQYAQAANQLSKVLAEEIAKQLGSQEEMGYIYNAAAGEAQNKRSTRRDSREANLEKKTFSEIEVDMFCSTTDCGRDSKECKSASKKEDRPFRYCREFTCKNPHRKERNTNTNEWESTSVSPGGKWTKSVDFSTTGNYVTRNKQKVLADRNYRLEECFAAQSGNRINDSKIIELESNISLLYEQMKLAQRYLDLEMDAILTQSMIEQEQSEKEIQYLEDEEQKLERLESKVEEITQEIQQQSYSPPKKQNQTKKEKKKEEAEEE